MLSFRQVEELYDLDNASMDRLKPIFGLVFLFKWRKEIDPRPVLEEAPEGVFFAKQMVPRRSH
jgi:ubiquitin carboxyl-terminal hydrolase L5